MLKKYLNPKYDIAFKKIFGTEKNKKLLLNFLNEVIKGQIDAPIEDVTFLKTVQDPSIAAKKQSIVDVLCKDKTGVQYIIEMQMTKSAGFEERAQYYAAKAYVDQMQAGNKQYENLKKVIFIAIANYDIFKDKKKYKSEHVILDKHTHENDLNMFSFTFINLLKFAKDHKEPKDLTLEEKWYYFLANAEETTDSDLNQLIGNDIVIKEAYSELERFGWSEEELVTYEREIKRQLDEEAIERQKEIDRAQRLKDAVAAGMAEGKAEVARNLLSINMDVKQISQLTGLSEEEISKL